MKLQTATKLTKEQTRHKILEIYADPRNDELRRDEVAKLVGISRRMLQYHLADGTLWDEARNLRESARKEGLCRLDTAMFDKGIREGDVPAARLMYQRWDGLDDKKGGPTFNINVIVNYLDALTVKLFEVLSRELGCPERAKALLGGVFSELPDVPAIGTGLSGGNGDNQDTASGVDTGQPLD